MATILHSLYGRFLGVDKSGYVTGRVGAKWPAILVGTSGSEALTLDSTGIKVKALYVGSTGSEVAIFGSTAVVAATSATTATSLTAGGVNTIALSTADYTFALSAPAAAGLPVVISRLTTSTATTSTVNMASGVTVGTSAISTGSIMAFTGLATLSLMSVSTAAYVATAVRGTVTIT